MADDWAIPAYSVRVSKRARQVTIKVSSLAGLEVVVPTRFKRSDIPDILRSKAGWIEKSLAKIRPAEELRRPDSFQLGLLGESWSVDYEPTTTERVTVSEQTGNSLVLSGPVAAPTTVAATLNQWLQKRAKSVLPPWLERLSEELSLPFSRVSVRRHTWTIPRNSGNCLKLSNPTPVRPPPKCEMRPSRCRAGHKSKG